MVQLACAKSLCVFQRLP